MVRVNQGSKGQAIRSSWVQKEQHTISSGESEDKEDKVKKKQGEALLVYVFLGGENLYHKRPDDKHVKVQNVYRS